MRKNLTNQRFGRLVALEPAGIKLVGKRKDHRVTWLCQCDCGNQVVVSGNELRSGGTRSCKCLLLEVRGKHNAGKYKDFTGQKFFRLTAVRRSPDAVAFQRESYIEKITQWVFHCDCGNERTAVVSRVRSGAIKDCGKHRGWSKHPLYSTWYGIKTRCYNKNQINYTNYGGRGVYLCERWRQSFFVFANDIEQEIGPKPPRKYTLDRINNDGPYEPGNVRWATAKQQAENQRPRKLLSKFSDDDLLAEFQRRNLPAPATSYSQSQTQC